MANMGNIEIVVSEEAQAFIEKLGKLMAEAGIGESVHDLVVQLSEERDHYENRYRKALEAMDELLHVIDQNAYGADGLHHHTCPAPEYGKCDCGAYQAVDEARAILKEGKGEKDDA